MKSAFALSVVISTFSPILFASQPTADDFAGRIDIEVPQSAGFALLGVTPDKVIDPQSGRDFGAALLQGLDGDGNFQSGFALETRPFLWNQSAYIAEPTTTDRILSGFKLSLATTTGLSDQDKANRYGFGVNWTYQINDPLFNEKYVGCIKKANELIPAIPTDKKDELQKQLIDAVSACQEQHISWTTTAVALGVAANKAEEDEMNLDESGFGAWLTGSLALNKSAELTGHVRYVDNQLATNDGALTQTDITVLAARFRYGGSSIRGILESSWNEEETDAGDNNFTLVSVGVEFKVMNGAWFRVAYGDTFDSSEENKEFFTGQIRFGFGQEPLSNF